MSRATNGRFQLTTDGFTPYRTAIQNTLGSRVDFAQLVKVYGFPERRRTAILSAASSIDHPNALLWQSSMEKVCTSHVERSNLTIRMTIRRLTRLTNAFSKKWENHEAALALFFAFYNYCRPHQTLTKERGSPCRPAMAAGMTDRVGSVGELLRRMAESTQS